MEERKSFLYQRLQPPMVEGNLSLVTRIPACLRIKAVMSIEAFQSRREDSPPSCSNLYTF